jgi:hypothetical protein
MAIAGVATLGTAQEKPGAPDNSLVLTTSAQLDAGNLGILIIAFDNTSAVDGNTTEVSSVVDSTGANTYSSMREYCNASGGAAGGQVVAIWKTRAASTLASAGTVTITFANSITSKTASFYEFTTGADVQVAGNATDSESPAGAQVISSLANKEYLFVRGCGHENVTQAMTNTTSYTLFGHIATSGSGAATNSSVYGEWRVLTGTGDTSDPAGMTGDCANVFIALEEITGGGGRTTKNTRGFPLGMEVGMGWRMDL